MKAFIASLVLLAVLMVCSVLNCFYIDRVTGKMLALCAEFPEKAAEGEEEMPEVLKAALSEWESQAAPPRRLEGKLYLHCLNSPEQHARLLSARLSRRLYLGKKSADRGA